MNALTTADHAFDLDAVLGRPVAQPAKGLAHNARAFEAEPELSATELADERRAEYVRDGVVGTLGLVVKVGLFATVVMPILIALMSGTVHFDSTGDFGEQIAHLPALFVDSVMALIDHFSGDSQITVRR